MFLAPRRWFGVALFRQLDRCATTKQVIDRLETNLAYLFDQGAAFLAKFEGQFADDRFEPCILAEDRLLDLLQALVTIVPFPWWKRA